MSLISYTTNPLTGRTIRVNGPTFNQLVMGAYDYLDGNLVRRVSAPPPPERESYLNIETGRLVQFGTRTYHFLINNLGYDIIEDYYLVPPRLSYISSLNPGILHIQNTQIRISRLNEELERQSRPVLERRQEQLDQERRQEQLDREFDNMMREIGEQWQTEQDTRQRESQLARLADLNIALCQECQMPVKLSELPETDLCEDCTK